MLGHCHPKKHWRFDGEHNGLKHRRAAQKQQNPASCRVWLVLRGVMSPYKMPPTGVQQVVETHGYSKPKDPDCETGYSKVAWASRPRIHERNARATRW